MTSCCTSLPCDYLVSGRWTNLKSWEAWFKEVRVDLRELSDCAPLKFWVPKCWKSWMLAELAIRFIRLADND